MNPNLKNTTNEIYLQIQFIITATALQFLGNQNTSHKKSCNIFFLRKKKSSNILQSHYKLIGTPNTEKHYSSKGLLGALPLCISHSFRNSGTLRLKGGGDTPHSSARWGAGARTRVWCSSCSVFHTTRRLCRACSCLHHKTTSVSETHICCSITMCWLICRPLFFLLMIRISLRAKLFIEVDKENGGGGTIDWLQVFTVGETELTG